MEHFVRSVKESNASEFAWRRLAAFQDVERMTSIVMMSRNIDDKQKPNVKKQMQQMAFSLVQAKEFFKSAENSGATTRSLMAYYGLTALANAQILWAGDGRVSFDMRPGRFNSHGFELRNEGSIWDYEAVPRLSGTQPTGLFGLWRSLASHFPNYAKVNFFDAKNHAHFRMAQVGQASTLNDYRLPDGALTLGRCLQLLPGMRETLDLYGRGTRLFRGRIDATAWLDPEGKTRRHVREYIIHYLNDEGAEFLGGAFRFHPNTIPEIEVHRVGMGMKLSWEPPVGYQSRGFISPDCFPESNEVLYFISEADEGLNEFGYYYAALYIAGMVTRYHPHVWIKEIRESGELAIMIDELVDHAIVRAPLLAVGQMEGRIYVYE